MNTFNLFNSVHNEIFGKDLIEKSRTIDRNANGIQISGKHDVKKVALGVSCNLEFLQKAVSWGADVCIFHHGLGLNDRYIFNSRLLPSTQQELEYIFKHDLTIAGYHYVLDVHPSIGNNVQIIKKLGAIETFEEYFYGWGWIGEFEEEKPLTELAHESSKLFKHDVFIVKGSKETVKRIGVCSGGAVPVGEQYWEMLDKHIDLHITGEIKESSPGSARELGISYFACGHYATEVFGIQALGEEIKQKFPELEVQFIEVWNEL